MTCSLFVSFFQRRITCCPWISWTRVTLFYCLVLLCLPATHDMQMSIHPNPPHRNSLIKSKHKNNFLIYINELAVLYRSNHFVQYLLSFFKFYCELFRERKWMNKTGLSTESNSVSCWSSKKMVVLVVVSLFLAAVTYQVNEFIV